MMSHTREDEKSVIIFIVHNPHVLNASVDPEKNPRDGHVNAHRREVLQV